jgi:hypothetical protein
MSEDSSLVRQRLSLEHFLWRTRGRNWDYLFLVEPHSRYSHDWYPLHKQIFADSEPRLVERYVVGELSDQQSQPPLVFVATVFLDDRRKDAHGRPVAHYMVWLRPGEALRDVRKCIPQGWGHAVVSRVRYALDADDMLNVIGDDGTGIRLTFKRVLAATDRTMELEGSPVDAAECREIGVITRAMNISSSAFDHATEHSERCLAHRSGYSGAGAVTDKSDWNTAINDAIAQGEAWALLHDRGRLVQKFPTLPLTLQRINQAEVLRRIMKSFSGSQDDQFIQARTESLRKPIATRYLQGSCKGFDAVVNVLEQYERHIVLGGLAPDEAHTLLAQWIGHNALKTDRFIHNVYARLRPRAEEARPSSEDPLR